jgi:hypothetical protein
MIYNKNNYDKQSDKQVMLNNDQKNNIRNEIKELDNEYVHLLSSGNYDEMEKLRAKMASLEIKLR